MMDTIYIRSDDNQNAFKVNYVFDIAHKKHTIQVWSQLSRDTYQMETPIPDYGYYIEPWFPVVMVPDGFGYKGLIAIIDLPEGLPLRDVLSAMLGDSRVVDQLEARLNKELGRETDFARMVDSHFSE